MPRSIWNGTIAFGLISVPIKLYTATQSRTVHFKEVHETDGAPVEHRRFCAKEDEQVPYDEVVKGFEVASGEYVVVDKDEIAAAAGARSKIIDVEAFVDAGEIDPVFYEKTYWVGAGKDGEEGYRLLHDALEKTGRAGLGRFTFHNREYLAAVRCFDGVLALHTMRFADELVAPDDIDVPTPGKAPGKREVEMAAKLLDSLQQDFDPSQWHDEHREAVLELVKRKAAGKAIQPPEEEPPEEVDDLAAALEASLGAVTGKGKGKSSSASARKGAAAGKRSSGGKKAKA
jgi:DNA end-binding protein Ku